MYDWSDKKVVIIGTARQGIALARFLARHGARVVLNDRRSANELQDAQASLANEPIKWMVGGHPISLLSEADLVCVSGGVPLDLPVVTEARKRGMSLSNDSQIFLEQAPCPVIGITGAAGKTTTTTLVGRIAEASVKGEARPTKVWVGGNIGNPLIDVVDEMQASDLAVMELSSFQLELMTRSPQVAAVLNLTPNHLDRHGTMEAYENAKANIMSYQKPDDVVVLGRDDPRAWAMARKVRGRLSTFGIANPPMGSAPLPWGSEATMEVLLQGDKIVLRDCASEVIIMSKGHIQLRGEHNLLNVIAACAIAAAAGLPTDAIRAGVAGFRGVPHRLEFVRSRNQIDWYNDSAATTPERAMAGIRTFDSPLVLLAGGRDKDLPWDDFVDLICQRVDHLIPFGETAKMITEKVSHMSKNGRPYTITRCSDLQAASQTANELAIPGHVVLLSPGCTSFDAYRDFAERGEWFKKWVMTLK